MKQHYLSRVLLPVHHRFTDAASVGGPSSSSDDANACFIYAAVSSCYTPGSQFALTRPLDCSYLSEGKNIPNHSPQDPVKAEALLLQYLSGSKLRTTSLHLQGQFKTILRLHLPCVCRCIVWANCHAQPSGSRGLTLSMFPSLLGDSGVAGVSASSASAGVSGVPAGMLLDLRCRLSRMAALSLLLRGIVGVTRSSCTCPWPSENV